MIDDSKLDLEVRDKHGNYGTINNWSHPQQLTTVCK
jgi:hypothetical protein